MLTILFRECYGLNIFVPTLSPSTLYIEASKLQSDGIWGGDLWKVMDLDEVIGVGPRDGDSALTFT